ncbi:hypothetical protein [Methanobrevibacter sp.]|uniref:hypothetical protein n=1 Tax=Methanobrevibacter sp. TaxID=66852 RepID=UPI00388DEE48
MAQDKDKTFKYISEEHLKELLNMLPDNIISIDADAKIETLTGEQILIEPTLYRPDYIVRIGNTILMIEYQSSYVDTEHKKRFKVYISNFDYKKNDQNLEIIFLVISTAETSKTAKHQINNWDIFSFPIISLLETDEREIISNIKEKIDKQEKISDKEIIELALTPLMVQGRENIINQFKELTPIMNEINYETEKIKESLYGIILMLGNMYFEKDDPLRKDILGDFMTKVDCIEEFGEEQYNKGKVEGKIEGKIEGIKEGKIDGKISIIKDLLNENTITTQEATKKLLELNCETKTITKITGLNEEEIQKIKN